MVALLVSTLALLLIAAIMLIRANDLGWRPGIVWHIRRVGFVLAGCTPFAIVWNDWRGDTGITIYEALFRAGLAFVFTTTPYLPPFWRYFFHGDHHADARGMPRKPGELS